MAISVGIDLGTTFSAVAYVNPKTKRPEIIESSVSWVGENFPSV